MNQSYIRPLVILVFCFTAAFISYYAGPPMLWGDKGSCVLSGQGIEVALAFPLDYPFLVEGSDSLRSHDRTVWVGLEPYTSLESILDDYLYAPDPTRYPYRPVVFDGYEAAAATDDGVLTGDKPTTYIDIPVAGGVVAINYELDAMSQSELSEFLGAIKITTGHSEDITGSTCYWPLLEFRP